MPPAVVLDSDDDSSDYSPIKAASLPEHGSSLALNEPDGSSANQEADPAGTTPMTAGSSPKPDEIIMSDLREPIPSPTMSKVKRCRTTMDLVSGSNKVEKAFSASKTTLDDLALQRSLLSEGLLRNDDEVNLVPERKRKRQELSQSHNSDSKTNRVYKKKKSGGDGEESSQVQSCTTSNDLHDRLDRQRSADIEEAYQSANLTGHHSQQASGSTSLSQLVDGALHHLQTSPHDESNNKLNKYAEDLDGNTPPLAISMESANFDSKNNVSILEAEDRDRILANHLNGATDQQETLKDGMREGSQKEHPHSKSVAKEARSLKRNSPEDGGPDELGLHLRDTGIPEENYKPRPSRSRGVNLPEEFLMSIDFSARPEKVIKKKSRLKRNKTTNDIPLYIPDMNNEDENITESSCQIVLPTTKGTLSNETIQASKDIQNNTNLPIVEVETRKRKRGRPRKDAQKADAEAIDHFDANVVADQITEPESKENLAPGQKKRGRKKKDLKECIDEKKSMEDDSEEDLEIARNSEELIDNDLDDELACQPTRRSRQKQKIFVHDDTDDVESDGVKMATVDSALQEKKGFLNAVVKPGKENVSEKHATNDLDLRETSSERTIVKEHVKTPEKANEGKGPGRHSPLNGSRVPYRVGLSRKARIEPLLRFVRK